MIKLIDLPKELQDAIYIEDCHVTGMHDPSHTAKYVCEEQLANLAKRVLRVIGINLTKNNVGIKDFNKIPRKLIMPDNPTKYSWYQYYKDNYLENAKELEEWQKNGFKNSKKWKQEFQIFK